MLIPSQRRLTDLFQELSHRQIAPQLFPHHHRVDEESDQTFALFLLSPRHRRSHADVLLPPISAQQQLEPPEHRQIQRHSFPAAQLSQLFPQLLRQTELFRTSSFAPASAHSPFSRQLQRRRTSQSLAPVL